MATAGTQGTRGTSPEDRSRRRWLVLLGALVIAVIVGVLVIAAYGGGSGGGY